MIEILRKQVASMTLKLEQKDMQIMNFRSDVARLNKENATLKAKMMALKEK